MTCTQRRSLASGSEPILDTAIFHCQQAGEKVMKGFLVFHDIRFQKTHDIGRLIELGLAVEPRFRDWRQAGSFLTPYAVAYRYPQDISEPDLAEFSEAFEAAVGLYRFALSVLPVDTHPVNGLAP